MIYLKKITKIFDQLIALSKIDLLISPAQTTVLIGPSGCGKSTLLRIVLGLIQPERGEVFIDDQPLSEANLRTLRRRFGYVIQDGGLFPHLTARENIALMAKYLGWKQQEIEERIAGLCELTEFPQAALDKFPAQLSGGQNQRTALMRALMLDPDILLLDEPLGALDPLIRFDLQQDLKAIFSQLGKTVVMVTHDLNEAVFFADRIVLMREGRIVQQGAIGDLIDSPAEPFVTQFIRAQRQQPELNRGAVE